MAHYAYLNDKNIVTSVFVGRDENDPLPEGFASWEDYYGAKRCSYNTQAGKHLKGGVPFRKNYPSVGWSYDPARDAFIDPKPFPSWIVDEETGLHAPPVPPPEQDNVAFGAAGAWTWDEPTLSWVYVEIDPVLGDPL